MVNCDRSIRITILTEVIDTDLHWSEESQMYCDANVNDEGESESVSRVDASN